MKKILIKKLLPRTTILLSDFLYKSLINKNNYTINYIQVTKIKLMINFLSVPVVLISKNFE